MTADQIKAVVLSKDYKYFEGDKNINIIGVRNSDNLTNEFDDDLYIVMEEDGEVVVHHFKDFTTDPGNYYLKKKFLNKDGCAILKPGQYRGMYTFGRHRGKYEALCQIKECTLYRDADKDDLISKGVEDTGMFGINLHHAFDSEDINRYSAGCQVLQRPEDLGKVLQLAMTSAKAFGNGFTYTLLEAKDFISATAKTTNKKKKKKKK